MTAPEKLLSRIRRMIVFFIIILALSGITAFPVYTELEWILQQNWFNVDEVPGRWLLKVWQGVAWAMQDYPFLFYGFDWLAFAHLVIAMAFIGPYKDPVRNVWVINWGMLACLGIIPLAVIAGAVRGIPWYHIIVDCLFGIIGIVPLWITRKWIYQLEALQKQ